jgi:hypothetical protein
MARQDMWRLRLVLALGCAATLGCGVKSESPSREPAGTGDRVGGISLSLVPVSGVTLSSVHYIVTQGIAPIVVVSEGDMPTPGSAKDFDFGLSLPIGTGYLINFSSAAVDVRTVVCGGTFGPFDVTSSGAPSFTVALACQDVGDGSGDPSIDVRTDACPRLVSDFAIATPSLAFVGGTLSLEAKAHDLDGKPVTYSWQLADPALGKFSPPNAPSTSLECTSGGQTIATATVSNGDCSKKLPVLVSCRFGECGNGVIDPGETCDPGIPGSQCPSDCISVCGNAVVEPPAEDCDPPNTPTCDATCHSRPIECNDGFLSPGEACDPSANPQFPPNTPPGVKCAPNCVLQTVECGDGVLDPGEECDPAGASATCSNGCQRVSTDACVQCELAGDCFDLTQNCSGQAGTAFTATQKTQCFSVMRCIEQSNCDDGTGTLGQCYCGSLSVTACAQAPFDLSQPGAANGACAAAIQAGMPGLTNNAAVLGGFTASQLPAGAAIQRLNCQKLANNSACSGTCGFSPGGPAFP